MISLSIGLGAFLAILGGCQFGAIALDICMDENVEEGRYATAYWLACIGGALVAATQIARALA